MLKAVGSTLTLFWLMYSLKCRTSLTKSPQHIKMDKMVGREIMREGVFEAKIEKLEDVQDFIANELESAFCSIKLRIQIAIAIEEIFVNIAHYAYRHEEGASGNVTIRIAIDEAVEIQFEDSGVPFNPLAREDPDITLRAEERKLGGLGIFMVKKIMDGVEYQHKDNKNVLVIKKMVA